MPAAGAVYAAEGLARTEIVKNGKRKPFLTGTDGSRNMAIQAFYLRRDGHILSVGVRTCLTRI